MADALWAELRGLFGQAIDSPAVTAFLGKYPDHKVRKPSDGHQAVLAPKHGFEMTFAPPGGAYMGGRSAHLRALRTLFLNSDAVPKFRSFATLPLGLSFADGRDRLLARLGPPERSWPRAGGGFMSDRWLIDGLFVHAEYHADRDAVKVLTLTEATDAEPGAAADTAAV